MSAAIVLATVVIVAGYAYREQIRLKIASVTASVPPKAAQTEPPSRRTNVRIWGRAPWALSALPGCFRQIEKVTGTLAYVERHIPAHYVQQPAGTSIRYNDCTVSASAGDVSVRRGDDWFLIPSPSRLYRNGKTLALLRETGRFADLRFYEPSVLP